MQRDIAKAKELYERSIELGQPQAFTYLGRLYEEGIGVQKNEKEAVRLYRIAADMGFDIAQCSLGNCYDFGIGVAVDYEEALSGIWLQQNKARMSMQIVQCGRKDDHDRKTVRSTGGNLRVRPGAAWKSGVRLLLFGKPRAKSIKHETFHVVVVVVVSLCCY